ncbi:MAG: hypothetical protein KC736_00310 [Candidatus Moranbacteria bacterium]|nr:hypothetical protein [Candidatus Moranbacteria bacterium]
MENKQPTIEVAKISLEKKHSKLALSEEGFWIFGKRSDEYFFYRASKKRVAGFEQREKKQRHREDILRRSRKACLKIWRNSSEKWTKKVKRTFFKKTQDGGKSFPTVF